jgi:hypothetical protein
MDWDGLKEREEKKKKNKPDFPLPAPRCVVWSSFLASSLRAGLLCELVSADVI